MLDAPGRGLDKVLHAHHWHFFLAVPTTGWTAEDIRVPESEPETCQRAQPYENKDPHEFCRRRHACWDLNCSAPITIFDAFVRPRGDFQTLFELDFAS